jgi:phosphate transport system permease protein
MSATFDSTAPLFATGNLRRRSIVSRLLQGAATGSALLALAVLGIVLFTVVRRGASVLSPAFVGTAPSFAAQGVGAILPEEVGTAVVVGVATLIAMPIGVLVAIYVTEYAGKRAGRAITLALDLMQGLPSIVIALFVFGLLFKGIGQTGFTGSVGLAVIMVPLIARASQEVLRLVPGSLREAADALGVARWRSILGVILPTALGGILTGTILALARAAGETAPMIILNPGFGYKVAANPFGHLQTLPFLIWTDFDLPDPESRATVWGTALVLLIFILLANVGARTLLAGSRRRLGG